MPTCTLTVELFTTFGKSRGFVCFSGLLELVLLAVPFQIRASVFATHESNNYGVSTVQYRYNKCHARVTLFGLQSSNCETVLYMRITTSATPFVDRIRLTWTCYTKEQSRPWVSKESRGPQWSGEVLGECLNESARQICGFEYNLVFRR